jgi:hypothetical protein
MELKSRRKHTKLQLQNVEQDNNIIMLNIDNAKKDIPFVILGNSNFDQKYIHIREVYKDNLFYEARYGYFSKINEQSNDDIYTLTLFSNKRLLYFTSEYGISLSAEEPVLHGIIVVDHEINENTKKFVVSSTKNCSIIIR